MGLYDSITLEKSGVSDHACSLESYVSCPVTLTPEKLKQLAEQHDRFIKTSVAGYIRPPFLPLLRDQPEVSKQKRHCSQCDGTGHVQPGKKATLLRKVLSCC